MGRLNDFISQPFDTEVLDDMTQKELLEDYLLFRTYFRISPILLAVAFVTGAFFIQSHFNLWGYLIGVALFSILFFILSFGVTGLIRHKVPKYVTILLIVLLPALWLLVMIMKH